MDQERLSDILDVTHAERAHFSVSLIYIKFIYSMSEYFLMAIIKAWILTKYEIGQISQ